MEKGRRLAEIQARFDEWRRQRTLSHERGFKPEPLDPTLADTIPEDQEIVLLEHPSWFPREPHTPSDMGAEIHFPPQVASKEIQYLQRKQMRRVTQHGKRNR